MDEASPRTEVQSGRRRPWFGLLLAAALITAGVGAWMLGEPPERMTARVLGPPGPDGQPTEANPPINPGARDARDISANNSPTLARNPKDPANLVVSNRIDRPSFSCALHASFDFGSSWQPITVPFPAGEEEPPRCFAPDVAYASDGTLYMSFVTLKGTGNVPNAVWVVSSKDGGRTLSVPVRAAGPLSFQVQLTTDASQPDRLYLNWLQAEATGSLLFPETGYPIVSSTSIDGGATWSAPVRVSPPSRQRVVAPAPALGPNGELYVLYLDLLEDRLDYGGAHEGRGGEPYDGPWALVLARSTDQGRTWEEALVDGEIRPTERFIVFLPPNPSLAVDSRSGQLYIAFTDGRAGDADVNLWTSTDGGRTFSPPLRVNDTRVGDGTSQYLPRLDVAPTGRLDVVYFDRRADLADIYNEVSLQSSFDQGRTFTRRVRVSNRAFDSRIGPGSERGLPDLGTRLALVSTNRRALAVWTDTRGGTELTGKQDLASAVVEIPPPARASRSWLRVVGAVAVLLGLVSLVLTLRSRRSAGGVVLYDPTVARPEPVPKRRRARPVPPEPAAPVPQPVEPAPADAPVAAAKPGPSYTPGHPPAPPGGEPAFVPAADAFAPQPPAGAEAPQGNATAGPPAERPAAPMGAPAPRASAPPAPPLAPEPPVAPQPPGGPRPPEPAPYVSEQPGGAVAPAPPLAPQPSAPQVDPSQASTSGPARPQPPQAPPGASPQPSPADAKSPVTTTPSTSEPAEPRVPSPTSEEAGAQRDAPIPPLRGSAESAPPAGQVPPRPEGPGIWTSPVPSPDAGSPAPPAGEGQRIPVPVPPAPAAPPPAAADDDRAGDPPTDPSDS